ncbi:MAG: histidinol-phosphate transaminase [Acidimicrobiales bacterium]
MTARLPLRPNLAAMSGYHSPQVPADVRLNTNESPYPPPETWREELAAELWRIEFNRYPDRHARRLRQGVADLHGVGADEVFCANGSNEALQSLLLAYGGTGRRAALFEPTYALHGHICRLTGTSTVSARRDERFAVDPVAAEELLERERPAITFLCSPNNPTGAPDPPSLVARLLARPTGLLVVDEAYGQFARTSALDQRQGPAERLVVVRTFSKTWAMAAARLGYLVADAEVVAGCEAASLPYHLSAVTQAAGLLALRFREEMEHRVALIAEERDRLSAGLAALPVTAWPSDANFVLFRPDERPGDEVWKALVDRSVLIRDCSSWDGLEGCLRVTVGTPAENDRFLDALAEVLR